VISRAVRGASGFSLLETLIAIVVIGSALLVAAEMLYAALASGSLARAKGTAAQAAQDRMELLAGIYARNRDAAELTPGEHGPESVVILNPVTHAELNRYSVAWTVSEVPDPRPGKILIARQIVVTVTPVDAEGKRNLKANLNKAVSLATIICGSPP